MYVLSRCFALAFSLVIGYHIIRIQSGKREVISDMAEIFEAMMMIFFGMSWPFNIAKSIRTKSARGKSVYFLVLVDLGYLSGIISKFLSGNISWVVFFYVLNFLMVLTDIILYFIYLARDRRIELETAS